MKAASLTVPGTVGIKEVPSPEPAKGESLVMIRDLAHALANFPSPDPVKTLITIN